MSETQPMTTKKSTSKPFGVIGLMTTGFTTLFFTMVAAGCFLSVEEGWRSYRHHSVESSLKRLDALLTVKTWISPPVWINHIENFYVHMHAATLQKETACLKGFSTISQGFFQFQNNASSSEHNPFAREFIHTCSLMKNQILPLLSGALAVILKRFWVFVTALPLFFLSLMIGLVDGLVQRDIRKFQGARESSLLFHTIRYSGTALFFLPLLTYFAWLSPVSPAWFFIPMAVVMGLWFTFSLRFFKKYV
jgi:integrating conjugative element membrane protein (TIGR03747 family)